MTLISRRGFVGAAAIGSVFPIGMAITGSRASAASRWIEGGLPQNFPAQDYESVQSVVGLSHTNLEGVRELVTARPALAKAAWDWGFGDWETALGAASHVGQREIAALLIAHGARPDLFTFAMLGQVDVVRAICTANPGIQKIHGPHSITLLQHAINGGDEAKSVVSYLEELGDADIAIEDLTLDEQTAKTYLGEFTIEDAAGVTLTVQQHARLKCMTITPGKGSMRFLHHRGTHEFSPRGAAMVKITFDVQEGAAKSLSIRDGALTVAAKRSGA